MLLSTTPLHASEALRLQALQDTRLLDSADDPHFDTVVESTLRFCQTPMAALSLVDQDRQWFKSSYGLDVRETPRHHGLCAQTILQNDLLLIEDASIDPRFCDNPLVIGPTHLRFYAGYPIHAGPYLLPVGTLCVLDSAPRTLTEAQQQRLRTAAGLLSVMLDVQASNHAVQHLLEHSSEPMLLQCHEPTGSHLRANAATLLLTGFDAPTISQMGLSGLLQLGQPSAEVAIIERAIAQQRYACTTLQFSHASGRELTCELQLFPLFGQPSRQVLLLAPLPSNSLHTFFSALRLQDRQMLLALSVDSFWATDVELRLTEVAGRVFIGGEFEQVAVAYGKRPWEFPFADPDSADFDMLRQAWHKRQAFKNFEYALLWQGRTIWLSVSGYPVFDSDGEFVGFRGTNRDISSRKAISEALRQSDEQLRLLAYNTSDGLAVLEKGCIVFVSPSYLKLLGLPDAQALGTDEAAMLRLIHPDDQSRVVAILRDSISKKHSSCSLTCRVLHRDGHILWREDAYRFTYTATGDPMRSYIVARDVSARVESEAKLERLTEVLQQTERIARIGGWELLPETMAVRWTDEIFAMVELEHRDAQSLDQAIRFYTPDSRTQISAAVEQALSAGTPWDLELELTTARGNTRWVHSIGQVVAQEGKIERIFGTVQDVTTEVLSRRALKEQQHLMQICFDNVHPGIAVFSSSSVLYCNQSAKLLLGYPASEPLAKLNLRHILNRSDWRYLRGEPRVPTLLRLRRRDGQLCTCLVNVSAIRWHGEKRLLASVSPLSEADMVEVEIRATQQRYEKMLVTQLEAQHAHLAREIHDSLGANLVGISMMLKGLGQSQAMLADDLIPVMRYLQQSVETCRNLARGLMPIDDSPGAFWRMLEMLCQDYQNLGGVRCQFAMQGDFDHVAQETGNHLYRIAQESLSNAVKHGQASVIVVQLDESAGQCLMSIQDNGVGLIATDTTRSGILGIGMKTMRARARMIDSSLEIGGNDEGGVTVSVGWSATHPLHLQSASLDKKLRHH